jgi:hypothetical protein
MVLSFGFWEKVNVNGSVAPVTAGKRACCIVLTVLLLAVSWQARGQLISEKNLTDAVLERQQFLPIELDALDLNSDGVVNIADLTHHLLRVSNLVPSVAFRARTASGHEDDSAVGVPLSFTKAIETDMAVTYSLGGTATYGPKEEGGDFMIADGYDLAANTGAINVTAGATEAVLYLSIHDDAVFGEGMETIDIQLTGGDSLTYFLGPMQNHTFYVDDNDAEWQAGLEFPGGGYVSFMLEITQEEGQFSGRVVSDDGFIAPPVEGDSNQAGADGWQADFYAGTGTLRVEIGPIPVDPGLSFFSVHRSRYYEMEIKPGAAAYRYDPDAMFAGVVEELLEPVEERLGAPSREHEYLRREATGTVALLKQTSEVHVEEVTFQDADN